MSEIFVVYLKFPFAVKLAFNSELAFFSQFEAHFFKPNHECGLFMHGYAIEKGNKENSLKHERVETAFDFGASQSIHNVICSRKDCLLNQIFYSVWFQLVEVLLTFESLRGFSIKAESHSDFSSSPKVFVVVFMPNNIKHLCVGKTNTMFALFHLSHSTNISQIHLPINKIK